MAKSTRKVAYQKSAEYKRSLEKAKISYRKLGITAEIELAVIRHLEEIGVLDYCGDQGKCTGGCPEGQGCIRSSTGNCLCSVFAK